jgi:hypothetical protein
MMKTSETEAVDSVVTSLIDSRLRLVGAGICLIDFGAVELKLLVRQLLYSCSHCEVKLTFCHLPWAAML